MSQLRVSRALLGSLFAAALLALWMGSRTGAEDKPKAAAGAAAENELRDFMRKKLDASAEILEGLTTDDLGMVKDGARKLREMSTAEKFRVSNDPIYRQFNSDFHEITQQLIKAAEDGNADRVPIPPRGAKRDPVPPRAIRRAPDAPRVRILRGPRREPDRGRWRRPRRGH